MAFPHRVSSEELPQATLAHHLQDSTHISNEVVTAGITLGMLRAEASGFHGAEPNENRWNIDHGAIDSYTARITLTPNANWTGQISAGRLTRPEAAEPEIRSAQLPRSLNRPFPRGNWATSLIWGRALQDGKRRQSQRLWTRINRPIRGEELRYRPDRAR